jgi:hypothetical protein
LGRGYRDELPDVDLQHVGPLGVRQHGPQGSPEPVCVSPDRGADKWVSGVFPSRSAAGTIDREESPAQGPVEQRDVC